MSLLISHLISRKIICLRSTLIKLEENDHLLCVTMHHIASDGWSTAILINEVAEFYRAYKESRQVNLLPLKIHYADHALWQRKYLQGEAVKQKLLYWKNKLEGVTPLELPADYTRPVIQSVRGAIENFKVEKSVLNKLQALSLEQGATLFMTLLSAFKVLLHRYTRQEDICVGSPIANRTNQEAEPLIGFFVNTLALRSEVNGQDTFIDLLQNVKATTLEAYENQDVPFEKVVEAVVKERDPGRTPLFQVMFVLQNTPEAKVIDLGDVQLSREKYNRDTSKYDITFFVTETQNGIEGEVEYCTDLYSRETIRRITGHYINLLNSIVAQPEQKTGLLPMVGDQEKKLLLETFNNTHADYPNDKSLVDLFEQQVVKSPGATAVIFEDAQLSYGELNKKANQLARYIINEGIQPESLIPICIERSLEMIIGILGVLKAGCAYVPIDPEYPEDRISYMLEDTAAAIVLTGKRSKSKVPSSSSFTIIELDSDWGKIEQESPDNLLIDIKPNKLAYVIYTSGSTGKPKGAMNEHGGVVNRLLWAQDYFQLTNEDAVLQKTTFSFDVSVWELLWPLLAGAKMVFAKPGGHKDNEYLKNIIDTQQITIMHFVPSMLEVFLPDIQKGDCKNLKKVLCSGEALKQSQVALFKKKLPNIELHNLYGPTESAIDVTCWSITSNEEATKVIPIGKPVANTYIYVLEIGII